MGLPSPEQQRVQAWLASFMQPDPPRGDEARQRSRELLDLLGRPQDRVPAVHVVGTAGKGTVATAVAESLRAAGQSVGLHRSPHVDDVRERFTVDRALPAWELVAVAVDEVDPVSEKLRSEGRPPTFFAVTTALALVMARNAQTRWLVVEAGIGGRHDATNVFGRADVLTVITAVGRDHQEVLGHDPVLIAAEKAAVMEGRQRAVLGYQPHLDVGVEVRRLAVKFGVDLIEVAGGGSWLQQAEATAAAALALLDADVEPQPVPDSPGRYERHQHATGHLIFDGAHNPLKLRGLAELLADEPRPRLGILALGSGKDPEACADALAGVFDELVVTEFGPDTDQIGPRSLPAESVAEVFRRRGQPQVTVALDQARAAALAQQRGAATTVVTGSFLHLTSLRTRLLNRNPEPEDRPDQNR